MNNKGKLNKISGIGSISMVAIIIAGYISGSDSLLGFPNAMLLYALMPLALIWFGTRKNGCGSCNQTCLVSESEQAKIDQKSMSE